MAHIDSPLSVQTILHMIEDSAASRLTSPPTRREATTMEPIEMKEPQDRFVASEEALHDEARKLTDCDDVGEPSYLEDLRVLLELLDESKTLSALGRVILRGQVVASPTNRQRCEQRLNEHPEVLGHEIRRPAFLAGLVRSSPGAYARAVPPCTT